jgi:hypothetical protein
MPDNSFIRFTTATEQVKFLPILEMIYKWESGFERPGKGVAGPWAGRIDIRNCTWTRSEMITYLNKYLGGEFELGHFNELIDDYLIPHRHLLRIPNPEAGFEINLEGERTERPRAAEEVYITRMAEIVRTTGAIHEFVKRDVDDQKYHLQLIEGTKWEPRLRSGAPRNVSKEELVAKVRASFSTPYQLPSGSDIEEAIVDLELVLEVMDGIFGGITFSEFQVESIYHALLNTWSTTPTHKGIIITAGTGAGKTLGFVIPAIVDALIANRMARSNDAHGGVSQLILYPRNDLAKDQYSTISEYLAAVNDHLIDCGRKEHAISIAIDAGGLIKTEEEYLPSNKLIINRIKWPICVGQTNVFNGSWAKYKGLNGDRPANIMIAGLESFRRRLNYSHVISALKNNLSRVILDEIHLSSGTQGAHHALTLKRLQQACWEDEGTDISFIGASATIAKPDEHTAEIWQCKPNQIKHIDAIENNTVQTPNGIMNHIFVRTKKGASGQGTLVDMTSLIGHQRHSPELHTRPAHYKNLQKMIGFADSHDVVGNWLQLMRENESTNYNGHITDPINHNQTKPYAHWFSRPLEIHEGGDAVCNSCQNMEKSAIPITLNDEQYNKIQRTPNETVDNSHYFQMRPIELNEGETIEVRGLDTCPHLQVGTCWWFAPRTDETELITNNPNTNTRHTYRDVLRVKKHTSKSQNNEYDTETNANFTFRENPRRGAYPRLYPWSEADRTNIAHDIVIATPTLEVGIDMSNVTDVVTYKAIRNISSYRQKIGRGGREIGTDSIAATLMSFRASDFLHYRSTKRLIDRKILEPVPLATKNKDILRSEAYMSVFDYLAKFNKYIELIKKGKPAKGGKPAKDWHGWRDYIIDALDNLRTYRTNVITYCNYATNNLLDGEDIEKAIDTAIDHLTLFMTPYPCVEDADMVIADLVSWMNSGQGSRNPETIIDNVGPQMTGIGGTIVQISSILIELETSNPGIGSNFEIIESLRSLHQDNRIPEICNSLEKINDSLAIATVLERDNSGNMNFMMLRMQCEMLRAQITKLDQHSGTQEHNELVSQIKSLRPQLETTYLSGLLTLCPIFQRSSPYCMIGTLFANPYENQVSLLRKTMTEFGQRETATAKEALRYYLPGMWTFRAFNGQPLRIESGFLDGSDPPEWVEHYAKPPRTSPRVTRQGSLPQEDMNSIPLPLRADLHQGDLPVTMKLEEIYLEQEYGMDGSLQQVRLTEEKLVQGFDVAMGGVPITGRRPQAFSTTWDLATLTDNNEDVRTCKLSGMNEDMQITINALRHPMMNNMFSSLRYGEISVNRIATCVSRSNGVRIRFRHNGMPAVYADKFATFGIEFEAHQNIKEKIKFNSTNWKDLPFDTMVLRALKSILQELDGVVWNDNYAIEAYVDCLVELCYSSSNDTVEENIFPRTFGEFIELITTNPLTDGIIERRAQHGIGDKMEDVISLEIRGIAEKFANQQSDIVDKLESTIYSWMRTTYCNTLALLLQDTASSFAGVPADNLAYSFSFDTNDDVEEWKIYLYDEDANGNGTMEVVKNYFYIPTEIRDASEHFRQGSLPTTDFVSELERRIATCQEHISQSIAITKQPKSSLFSDDLWQESQQLIRDYDRAWAENNVDSVRCAALHNYRRYFIVDATEEDLLFTLDYQRQALELCDSGCPACNGDSMQNAFRGTLGELFTCRSLIDTIVNFSSCLDGYKLKDGDEQELAQTEGLPLDPAVEFTFKPLDGGNGSSKRLRFSGSAPISINWTRNEENNNPDLIVRHQEAI